MPVSHRRRTTAQTRDVGIKYTCSYCQKDVTLITRIHCAVCEDTDLCVECFSTGKNVPGGHIKTHPYRVMEPLTFPILTEDWSAEEELLLMDGLRKFGLGNWSDISDGIGSKTVYEVEKHYYETMINSPYFPIPDTSVDMSHAQPIFMNDNSPPLNPTSPTPTVASSPACHEIVGYMPGRKEFETECENDAEAYVKDLVFPVEADFDYDFALKLTLLFIYNFKLARKKARKAFIFEHSPSILNYKAFTASEKKRSKRERELLSRYRVFAHMLSKKEWTLFRDGILREQKLIERVRQLQEWRLQGLTRLSQAALYEKDRQKSTMTGPGLCYSNWQQRQPQVVLSHLPFPRFPLESASQPVQPSLALTAPDEEIRLLDSDERDLCAGMGLKPKLYQTIKLSLLNAALSLDASHRTEVLEASVSKIPKPLGSKTAKLAPAVIPVPAEPLSRPFEEVREQVGHIIKLSDKDANKILSFLTSRGWICMTTQ